MLDGRTLFGREIGQVDDHAVSVDRRESQGCIDLSQPQAVEHDAACGGLGVALGAGVVVEECVDETMLGGGALPWVTDWVDVEVVECAKKARSERRLAKIIRTGAPGS